MPYPKNRKLICWLYCLACAVPVKAALVFSCDAENDLYRTAKAAGLEAARYDTPREAVERARPADGVLVLADGYPSVTTAVTDGLFEQAASKRLRVFVEYPGFLPGRELGAPKPCRYERAVVTADFFGDALPAMRILAINGLSLVPAGEVTDPLLAAARVAGFDHAVYGLPEQTYPLLFEHDRGNLLVATTQLSRFITARYAPQDAWQAVWAAILGWLQPRAGPVALMWEPSAGPSYGPETELPPDAEIQAVRRGVAWFANAKLFPATALPAYEWRPSPDEVEEMKRSARVREGLFGIHEGVRSQILPDGSQPLMTDRRGDCTAESAMALAFGGSLLGDGRQAAVAKNLLDFYLFASSATKRERADPANGAYGMIAWGIDSKALYVANYGDDNARLMLGVLATAALNGDARWDATVMRCLLGNLRTSGRFGFRGGRLDVPELSRRGWEAFFTRNITNYTGHYECYLWACYLWAYHKTGFDLFYERAETAIRMMMEQGPGKWRWTNGLTQEKARMLLPLAWLVRVRDTPEHRAWLQDVVDSVVALQAPCGAIREELGPPANGRYPPPRSNADYGKHEAPLIQKNGDPVADMLYTANFAFIGLHEAAAVGNTAARDAADKLAAFLCRIQIRAQAHPALDGGWFRAFDFRRWEAWASNADAGWGAWAIESGWTQGWIVSTLALRQLKTSLWDLTARSGIAREFDALRRIMLSEAALRKLTPSGHAAKGCPVTLARSYAPQYPSAGRHALTDGETGAASHQDKAWQGFHGVDLEAVVDLGKPVPDPLVEMNFLENVRIGIYLPTNVIFSVSRDNRVFQAVSNVILRGSSDKISVEQVAARLEGHAPRYLRVQAFSLGVIPGGHRSAGAPAWLFADEIRVSH